MHKPEEQLQSFIAEARHLTSPLNNVASDMIRDRDLTKKLDDDPDYFIRKYALNEEELRSLRGRDVARLFELGMHPFLVVRFAGMMGILEYWKALGAPGREGYKEN
jgi:hypothetical protein